MRPAIFHLVYVSAAVRPFTKAQLIALLEQSRAKNYRLGVTGLLVYRRGWFMQVLEGEERVVRGLFETIAHDLRHRGVVVMDEGTHARRQFPSWSMGFRDLADRRVRALQGFSEFMNGPRLQTRAFDPKGCLQLLRLFATSGGTEDAPPAAQPATAPTLAISARRAPSTKSPHRR